MNIGRLNKIKGVLSWIIFIWLSPAILSLLLIFLPICRFKSFYKQKKRIKPRIIWGPTPIINIKYNSHINRKYGYQSDTLVYDLYSINRREDFDYVVKFFNNRLIHWLSILAVSYPIFLWLLWKYDIFQFYFDGGYLQHTPLKFVEYPFLKMAGKKMVASPYGGDVTMPSRIKNKYKWNVALFIEKNYPDINEQERERNVQYHTKYADYIIGVGELIEFMPRCDIVLPVNSTVNLSKWKPVHTTAGDVIKIVHASNHRALKGTQYLINACEELKKEGYPIELILVEKMKNEDAKKIYEQADIIADQFLIGWYALFASEGMALGKPVLCYLRDNLIEANRVLMKDCPIVNTNPDNLKENIIKLIENKELRMQLGLKGRQFVEKYGEDYVGQQMDIIYRSIWFGDIT